MNQSPDKAESPANTNVPPYASNMDITESDTTSLMGDDMDSRRCMRLMALKCSSLRNWYASLKKGSALKALTMRIPAKDSSSTETSCPSSSLPRWAWRFNLFDQRLIKTPVTGKRMKAKSVSFQLRTNKVTKLTKIIKGDLSMASIDPMTECSTSIKSWVNRLITSPFFDSVNHAMGMDNRRP